MGRSDELKIIGVNYPRKVGQYLLAYITTVVTASGEMITRSVFESRKVGRRENRVSMRKRVI